MHLDIVRLLLSAGALVDAAVCPTPSPQPECSGSRQDVLAAFSCMCLWEGYHDAQGAPNQSHISPSILVYEDCRVEERAAYKQLDIVRLLLSASALVQHPLLNNSKVL